MLRSCIGLLLKAAELRNSSSDVLALNGPSSAHVLRYVHTLPRSSPSLAALHMGRVVPLACSSSPAHLCTVVYKYQRIFFRLQASNLHSIPPLRFHPHSHSSTVGASLGLSPT
jgi:hypothetical protein